MARHVNERMVHTLEVNNIWEDSQIRTSLKLTIYTHLISTIGGIQAR